MGELYISRVEQEALKKIDSDELNSIVMECIRNSQTGGIYQLGLEGCGIYISNKLRDFQKAIDSHSRAKSSKKALRRWVWNSPPELGQDMTSTWTGGTTWTARRF